MDTPLHPIRRAGRWLSRFAAVTLVGSCGCGWTGGNNDFLWLKPDQAAGTAHLDAADKAAQAPTDPAVVQAKNDSSWFDWSDWEWEDFDLFGILPKSAPEVSPSDAVVLQGDNNTPVKAPPLVSVEAKLALAQERFLAKDYVQAVKIFHRIANHEKNPPKLVQEAKFYEAECHYFLDEWPKAGDTYVDLMNKFPRNAYRIQALTRMYEIADFWLEDTRQEMREYKEKENGQRWFVTPRFVSFETKKPLLDREGRAIQLLEAVRYGDINGPMADKALFLCGSVQFFNENYKEADYYFSELSKKHVDTKTDKMAENATRLAIIAKHMSTGGADYDGRKVAEARILVQDALNRYPELNQSDDKGNRFLANQIVDITAQQAEKDYKMGEFYERIGHPGAAVWQYELVIRRYHGTEPYCSDAIKRRDEILKKMDKNQLAEPAPTPPRNQGRPVEQAPAPRVLPPDLGPGH